MSRVEWRGESYLTGLKARLAARAEQAGALIAGDMRGRAPKDTGTASASIRHEVTVEGDTITIHAGAGDEGWYLAFHEEGTSKMAATPWARPAVIENKGRILDTLKD